MENQRNNKFIIGLGLVTIGFALFYFKDKKVKKIVPKVIETKNDEVEEELEEDAGKKNEMSSKKNFIFKNYINKLNLQSKEMIHKIDYVQNTVNTSSPSYKPTLNSSSLSGSTYRIYNICKNIHKNNDFSNYNTINTTCELSLT